MRRQLTLATFAAVALGLLVLTARPAQAHVTVRPAGHVAVHLPTPYLTLPLWQASYYGGDLVLFYDAGYWWTFVDDQLYITYQDGDAWLLYRPYTVTTVRPRFTYRYADACYAGRQSACRQWYTQVRYDYRHRPQYRATQQRYWSERERAVRTHRASARGYGHDAHPGRGNGNAYGHATNNGRGNGNAYGHANSNGNGNAYGHQNSGNNGNGRGNSNGRGNGRGNGNRR